MSDGNELVEVAFVGTQAEGLIIQAMLEENGIPSLQQQVTPSGPQLAYGLLNPGGGSQRVMVHAHRAEEARALLAEAQAENESPAPELTDAEYLADAEGWKPRRYGLIGGYARATLWSLGAMAIAFGIFTLVRAL